MGVIFAEVTNTEATLIGVISAIIAGVPSFGAFLWQFLKWRRESAKTDRADAIHEWKEYADRQDKDIDRLQARCDEQDKRIFAITQSESDCLRHYAEAKEKTAQQAGTIGQLTADVRRLQAITRDTHPGVTMPVIIIAGIDGVIVDVTAACGSMFHWLPQELRGKNVSVLVPERLKAAHTIGLTEVASGQRRTDPAKAIATTAVRRDGTEFEVLINLSSWKSPLGSEFITAEIREQPSLANKAILGHH